MVQKKQGLKQLYFSIFNIKHSKMNTFGTIIGRPFRIEKL